MAAGPNYNLIGAGGFTGGVIAGAITGFNGTAANPAYQGATPGYGLYFDGTHTYIASNGVQALSFDTAQGAIFAAGLTVSGTLKAGSTVTNNGNVSGLGWSNGNDANGVYFARLNPATYPLSVQAQDYSTGVKPGCLMVGALGISKTTNYTLTFSDLDVHFDTTGAAGSVAFTLPTPQKTFRAWFCATAAQVMTVVTPSGSIFAPGALTGATRTVTATVASAQYTSFCVECKDGTNYVVTCLTGTMT